MITSSVGGTITLKNMTFNGGSSTSIYVTVAVGDLVKALGLSEGYALLYSMGVLSIRIVGSYNFQPVSGSIYIGGTTKYFSPSSSNGYYLSYNQASPMITLSGKYSASDTTTLYTVTAYRNQTTNITSPITISSYISGCYLKLNQ